MKKLQKVLIFITVMGVLVFAVINFRYVFPGKYAIELQIDYDIYIMIKNDAKKNNFVDFSEMFPFEWDSMYIFSFPNVLDSGLKEYGIESYSWLDRFDAISQIAFIKNNIVVGYFGFDLGYLKFDEKSIGIMINREEAAFNAKFHFRLLTLSKKE